MYLLEFYHSLKVKHLGHYVHRFLGCNNSGSVQNLFFLLLRYLCSRIGLILYLGPCLISLNICLSKISMAKLYNCEKNGTIFISSEPCNKRRSKKLLTKGSKQTCFLQDRKTLEQSLVSNPSRQQLRRSTVIWCKPKGDKEVALNSKNEVGNKINSRPQAKTSEKKIKKGRHSLPKRASAFKEYVQKASKLHNLPEALLWAFMKVESDFIPSAVSRVGAQGLMQLMPFTAKDMGVNDPFDPEQNIFGAAKLISILMKRFNGELPLVISAYHAGGGAVTKKEGIPYTQTSQYMTAVLNAYYRYMKIPPYTKRDKN